LIGAWRTFDELEETICVHELRFILEASHKVEKRKQYFAASLKGIDLEAEETKAKVEAVKRRGFEKNHSEADILGELGIEVIDEEE